jgi:haloalkane dehalogenase
MLDPSTILQSRTVQVHGQSMHYLEAGEGRPVVFLHGNPTSSELWRGVIPQVALAARCIAPDLIGMGLSAKPHLAYRFADHARFVGGFIDVLALNDLVLVTHDWGVALGADYFAKFPGRVRGIAMMEGRIDPMPSWRSFDSGGRKLFRAFRTPGRGECLVIEQNMLIEAILQAGTIRKLTDAELHAYRVPYLDPASRYPLLQWTREIPIAGDPPDVTRAMTAAKTALSSSEVPKLVIHGHPGIVVGEAEIERWRRDLPNLTVVDVGPGGHFLPHDRPDEIGQAIVTWLGCTLQS